jgi:hypothetical protein
MKLALLATLVLLPGVSRADEVFTRGGGQISGEIVERRADAIVVDVGGGTIGLPISYIERIVPGPSPMAVYRQKAQRLAADDTAGWFALARWAREQDLRTQADEALGRVLAIDPDHVAARQALGYVKVGERWMTREEGNRAQGLVSFEGQWMTPAERQVRVMEREVAVRQAQDETEAVARIREIEARAREAEANARVAEAEARIAEADAGRAEYSAIGLQWIPAGSGLQFVSHGSHRSFGIGCDRRLRFGARVRGAIPVAGRGGAFVVAEDLRATVRR